MTFGCFSSTGVKVLEGDCSHKVNPRYLLAVVRRAAFGWFSQIWSQYSSILRKDGGLRVSSPTRSITIPCWRWPSPVRYRKRLAFSVSVSIGTGQSFRVADHRCGISAIGVRRRRLELSALRHPSVYVVGDIGIFRNETQRNVAAPLIARRATVSHSPK
jgi:hypothetical protein